MSSSKQTEGTDRVDPKDLKISAAIANQNGSGKGTAITGTSLLETLASESLKSASKSSGSGKLPPSPLVTPPMGSNPSQAAQEAVSPRNLLPAPEEASAASSNGGGEREHDNSKQPNRGVPHVYHDYAKLSGPGPAYIRKKTGGVTQPFPDKLHEMLSQESSDDPASAIVSWLPHGRAFIVRKPKEFTTEIMPKYFRQTKLTSFQRQLNLYGFRRITQGADSGAYYHPLFLQGRPSLSQRMVRQKVKGTGHKQPSDASSEPNFYTMPPVEPEYPVATTWGARYKPTIMPPLQEPQPVQPPLQVQPDIQSQQHQQQQETQLRIDPNSPGFTSLHGAAQLLHGISAGRGGAFLGPPANAASAGTSGTTRTLKQKPASFLEPDQVKEV